MVLIDMQLKVYIYIDIDVSCLLFSENLFHCPSQEMYPIKHWEIGKYFQAFKGDRYVPNHALLEKYPELKE